MYVYFINHRITGFNHLSLARTNYNIAMLEGFSFSNTLAIYYVLDLDYGAGDGQALD